MKQYLKILRNFFVLFGIVPLRDWWAFLYFSKDRPGEDETVQVRVKTLGNRAVQLRKHSRTDRDVFKYVFYNQYHLPHQPLPDDAVILDLGTNIGLTVAHYKHLYPGSRIFGYEMDAANYALALRNCAGLPDCHILNKAVWHQKGIVEYNPAADADAYRIDKGQQPLKSSDTVSVEALSINDIIEAHGLHRIDFIKMDVEGAEKEILTNGDLAWTDKVRCMGIEIHDKSFIAPAMKILESRGFQCRKDNRHWTLISAGRKS